MHPFGIYIHIPFCDGKCYYCNFFSKELSDSEMDLYTDRVISSLIEWSGSVDRNVDTIYFGGGTPSLIVHDRLIRILDTVLNNYSVSSKAEITAEVNPLSTDTLDFTALRRAGFNRLSIGMQSSNDSELKALGRRHSIADVVNTIGSARRGGFDNISLDVMLGIPLQTERSLTDTLRFCKAHDVDHVSAYILKVEEGTRFHLDKDMLPLKDEDEQAYLYELSVATLRDLGYRQYEISNFSKPGYESRHNLLYWHDDEYLGIGPSAHSFMNGNRFYYPDSFDDFYNNCILSEGNGGDSEEFIMLALRLTEGLSFSKYFERYNKKLNDSFMNAAAELEKKGLVNIGDSSLSLTTAGFLVSNAVIGHLLEKA